MSEQEIFRCTGDDAVKGWVNSIGDVISGCVEIHLSEVMRRKYGDDQPKGLLIITLPNNTITGGSPGIAKYFAEWMTQQDDIGMGLVDLLISEIKKIDIEVSEDDA